MYIMSYTPYVYGSTYIVLNAGTSLTDLPTPHVFKSQVAFILCARPSEHMSNCWICETLV